MVRDCPAFLRHRTDWWPGDVSSEARALARRGDRQQLDAAGRHGDQQHRANRGHWPAQWRDSRVSSPAV